VGPPESRLFEPVDKPADHAKLRAASHDTAYSHCRYVVPAKFDDVLLVHTRCVGLRGARFRYEYAIVRDDGTLMADGYTEHACVDAQTLLPTRVPDWLSSAVSAAESS
jgi:acyl-CoA thioesterase FadM